MSSSQFSLPKQIQQLLQEARIQGSKVILATGVFDLLHSEHITFLQKAKALRGVLFVGVESDTRVKQLKGEDRPIWPQQRRKEALEALPFVDGVFILPEAFSQPIDHESLIKAFEPDFFAVSSHTQHIDKKQRLVEKYGGHLVVVHQYNPQISTTQELLKVDKKM